VAALRRAFPDAEVLVADDGSRDGTAEAAERAGAHVVRLPRLGKGQALTLVERDAPPGSLLLCDADLAGDLAPLWTTAPTLQSRRSRSDRAAALGSRSAPAARSSVR
jgi:glycosyltransferase involved in cell wall biosynthesis